MQTLLVNNAMQIIATITTYFILLITVSLFLNHTFSRQFNAGCSS